MLNSMKKKPLLIDAIIPVVSGTIGDVLAS